MYQPKHNGTLRKDRVGVRWVRGSNHCWIDFSFFLYKTERNNYGPESNAGSLVLKDV